MDRAENPQPFPSSERVDGGPLAELQLTRQQQPVFVDHAFSRLDVRLGNSSETPLIEIVSGLEWPQARARYVIVQEAVVQEDPRRGWAPVGGVYPDGLLVGPSEAPQLSFPADIAWEDGVMVHAYDTFLSLTACGSLGATVRVGVADLLTAAEASARHQERVVPA